MSDTEHTSRLPDSLPPTSAAISASLPAPEDPQRRWAVEMTRQITELREDVRELTRIATRCFEELQRQGVKIRDLETEVEQLKARITLLPPSPEKDIPTAPDNPRPEAPDAAQ